MSKENKLPFGGFFIVIGAMVVCGYAVPISGGNDLVPLGGLFVGGWLGYLFEHVLFRLIIVALFILMIVARQAFFGAMFDANAVHWEPQQPANSIVQTKHAIPFEYATPNTKKRLIFPHPAFFLASERQKWV